jgi:hypothetical protein
VDEQLSKHKGLGWYDFLSQYEDRRTSSVVSGHRLSQPTSEAAGLEGESGSIGAEESRRSSASDKTGSPNASNSNVSCPPAIITGKETTNLRKQVLQRHQTFDAPSNVETDNLLVAAHSVRSNSCIAPVDISIRRLSGGINLIEESSLDLADEKEKGDKETKDDQVSPSEGQQSPSSPAIAIQPTMSSLPPLPPGHHHQSSGSSASTIHPGSAVQYAAVAAAVATAGSIVSSARSSFAVSRTEQKRREALWDLFQSECVFLYDHLMVLKNVFMEPLKKIQVEGFAMFAEPEVLFGNLDELCCVTYAFCKEFLSVILNQMTTYEVNATEALVRLFQKVSGHCPIKFVIHYPHA